MRETQIRYQELLCDFCGSSDPMFVYDADEFTQEVDPSDPKDHREMRMEGAWNACNDCAELISADQRDDLLERSLQQYGVRKRSLVYKKIRARIMRLHDEFFFSMTGTVTNIEDYVDPEGHEPGVVTIVES